MTQTNAQTQNEATYEELITLIETSQGRLAPIIVACDDRALREHIVSRYELEARQAKIQSYRIVLGEEPSLKGELVRLKQTDLYLQRGGEAVFTVTGAEVLLRVNLRSEDTRQTQLDKFFGYLQWTREGLREFPYPIVLWVTYRVLKEMSRRAPDFWGWRKAVLRFREEAPTVAPIATEVSTRPIELQPEDDEFLPPLEELQAQIQQLEATSPESASLATLYDRLGRVYAKRVEQGEATSLEQERQAAIAAFREAIDRYKALDDKPGEMKSFNRLGSFLSSQSRFAEAIDCHQQSLELAREIGNRQGEAYSLQSVGHVYQELGQYQRALDSYQQALVISREVNDRSSEATTLNGLGYVYDSLEQYQQAIESFQQALVISREANDRNQELRTLNGLGTVYASLGQHQRALEFQQQALEIRREIGDRSFEPGLLCNLGHRYLALRQYEHAIDSYQQALQLQRQVGNREWQANSLDGLGNAYVALEEYQQAIDFYQQELEIRREIGDRDGEAIALRGLGYAQAKLDRHFEAKRSYEQALQIYTELNLDYLIEKCKTAIYNLNGIIASTSIRAPSIRDEPRPPRRRRNWLSRLRQFLNQLWQQFMRRLRDR
jgi:tetratricopeptide (TPR) repeat protein